MPHAWVFPNRGLHALRSLLRNFVCSSGHPLFASGQVANHRVDCVNFFLDRIQAVFDLLQYGVDGIQLIGKLGIFLFHGAHSLGTPYVEARGMRVSKLPWPSTGAALLFRGRGLLGSADCLLDALSSFQIGQLSFQLCDGFFSIAYLLLNFARLFFQFPFGLHIAAIRNLSDPLLDGPFHFVEAAFELIFRAGFHSSPRAVVKRERRFCWWSGDVAAIKSWLLNREGCFIRASLRPITFVNPMGLQV